MKPQPSSPQDMSEAFRRAPVDVRGEWLLRKLRPAYARLPGGASAVVGRGRFDDLDQTCDALDPAAQRAWFGELISIAFPADKNPQADPQEGVSAFRAAAAESFSAFLKSRIRSKPGARLSCQDLHDAHSEWARVNNALPLTSNVIGRELTRRGFLKVKCSTIQWLDIELVPPCD